jgi:hypothetical protein
MTNFYYVKALSGTLGAGSLSNAAVKIGVVVETSGLRAALSELPSQLPALLLGIVYVFDAVVPDRYWDEEGKVACLAVHLVGSTLSLACLVLTVIHADDVGNALHEVSGQIAIYAALLVASMYKGAKLIRAVREQLGDHADT